MSDTEPLDLLIRGCTALTSDPAAPLIEDAAIGIRGDRLALVGTSAAADGIAARRVIDARGHLATPGFVNVHTHAVLSLARGMTEDMGFAPAYTPGVPHAYDITEDEAVALGRLDRARSHAVRLDHHQRHVRPRARDPAGDRRAWAAHLVVGLDPRCRFHAGSQQGVELRSARSARTGCATPIDLYDRWNGAFDGRASVMLAPHAIDTCSRDFLRDVNSERRRLGVRVMTHLAQSYLEVEQVRKRDGMTPTELLDDVGLLDEGLIAAHCLVMTEDDIARAGRGGITVAHAPKVNLTGGYLPVTSKLRRAGARIALATDNMHGDMVETMRWALASGRLQEKAVNDFWSAPDVFHMATLGAARSLGRDHDLGSLTVGKKADVVLLDFRRAHLTPAFNPVGTLVHTGQGRDVATVIVDGRIVVESGRATLVDEDRIRREGAAAAKALWTRVTGRAHPGPARWRVP